MRLIKPSVELITNINEKKILSNIERAGRVSHKSEDKLGNGMGKSKDFIRKLINLGHESVLEHESISVIITCDRGCTHEEVRHRIGSYTQECVTADTKIKTGSGTKTIKKLYEQYNSNGVDLTHFKNTKIKSVNNSGNIIDNRANEVYKSGIKNVYKVETELGYEIKCTLNERFKNTKNKFIKLNNLSVGDKIKVNGRPSLIKVSDEKMKKMYLDDEMQLKEIANKIGVSYGCVLRKVKKLDIFVPRKNDKNKEKYNKNHTSESYQKMRNTIKKQYKNGREPWNKGITGKDSHMWNKEVDDEFREKMSKLQKGQENSNWKGGEATSRRRARNKKIDINKCELCGNDNNRLEVHHKDGNKNNNKLNNLIKVCCQCHRMLHHDWEVGTREITDKIVSIEYVGKEQTYDIDMNDPYKNYIANGFIVHNSTRYCDYSDNHVNIIIPRWVEADILNTDGKRIIRGTTLPEINKNEKVWVDSMLNSEQSYKELRKNGIPPQFARGVLPINLKTEIYSTFNVRMWRHVFDQRINKYIPEKDKFNDRVHPQISSIMIATLKMFNEKIDVLFDGVVEDKNLNKYWRK